MSLTEPFPLDHGTTDRREDPAAGRLVMAALTVGLVLQVGLRGGVTNAVVVTAVGMAVAYLLAEPRLVRREARIVAALSLVPTAFLALRASPWLAWTNSLLAAAMLLVAAVHAREGSVVDTAPGRLLDRLAGGIGHGVAHLGIVRTVIPAVPAGRRDEAGRILRGVVVAGPILFVLVALLASADAVFASLVSPELDGGPIVGHVTLTVGCAAAVVALAGATTATRDGPVGRARLGVVEVVTVLGLVAAVLALFVVSQLVAVTGAGDRLVESAGLTAAEYARSGFFQLCWATALVLGTLALLRSQADRAALDHRLVVGLGGLVPALGLGLVVVSLRRTALYDEAFGLTMLRLWAVGASLWMGALLIMTAARNLGLGTRSWLTAGAGLVAFLLVLMANLLDAEAVVARHNLDRARDGAELDVQYLTVLSDDVVPVIADAIDDETDPDRRAALTRALGCGDDAVGVTRLNLARSRADAIRAEQCS